MVNFLGKIFAGLFGTHSGLATVIISMFPLIELKGGIPVGMSQDFWGDYALNGTTSFFLALLGSCLVVPILALIFKPIIEFLKRTKLFRKIGHLLDAKVKNHSESINNKTKDEKSEKKKIFLKMLFIFGFVAVPLPLTGVWTGTCVAVAIGLNFWQTVLSAVLGNEVAGLIIVTVCAVFPQFTTILFIIFLAFIVIMIIYAIIKNIVKSHKAKLQEGSGVSSEDVSTSANENSTMTTSITNENDGKGKITNEKIVYESKPDKEK